MKLTIIQTGGTFDKDYPRGAGSYAFTFNGSGAERILTRAQPAFSYDIIPLLAKDSLDMTDADRVTIRTACEKVETKHIVITHGTDTMIETARILETVDHDKTIVLTGSALPERFKDSDADFNLGFAVAAASTLPAGVYIAMSGRIYRSDAVRKDPTTGQFVDA